MRRHNRKSLHSPSSAVRRRTHLHSGSDDISRAERALKNERSLSPRCLPVAAIAIDPVFKSRSSLPSKASRRSTILAGNTNYRVGRAGCAGHGMGGMGWGGLLECLFGASLGHRPSVVRSFALLLIVTATSVFRTSRVLCAYLKTKRSAMKH